MKYVKQKIVHSLVVLLFKSDSFITGTKKNLIAYKHSYFIIF